MPKKTTTRASKKAAKPAKKSVKPTKKALKPAKKAARKTVKKTTAKKAVPKKAATKPARKESVKTKKKAAAKTAAKKITAKPLKQTTAKAIKKAAAQPTKKAAGKSAQKAATKKALKQINPGKAQAPAATRVAASTKPDADDSKPSPIVFSLEDVEQLMAAKKQETQGVAKAPGKAVKKTASPQSKQVAIEEKPHEHRKLGAASLADILGFNPAEKKKNTALSSEEVPRKWKKYYKLLIELREHVRDEIDLHSSDTLKHSARDDSGDLSGYGSHQADAGTDNFDRDFALSLVSSEHEALNEIEDAILRIKKGTYGICEVTGKPIPAARLTAVPFARYSIEGQAEYEKNLRRKYDRGGSTGLFSDTSDAPKIAADDDDD